MGSTSDDTLDSLISGPSTSQLAHDALNSHLSFPSASSEELQTTSDASTPTQPQLCKDRIYVGNLHPSVDEYMLFQVFSKFGKVTSLDFLFHKSGPLKGKPRGYAFVKYEDESDAHKAISTAHDKLLRGRKIAVTFAHHAPTELIGGNKGRRTMMEIGRTTTLSLLKSGTTSKPIGTAAKIAKMEAKLRQLERSSIVSGPNPAPLHPSLPPKPQTSSLHPEPRAQPTKSATPPAPMGSFVQRNPSLPSLLKSSALTLPPSTSAAVTPRPSKPKLVGVRIKPKEKDKPVPPKSD